MPNRDELLMLRRLVGDPMEVQRQLLEERRMQDFELKLKAVWEKLEIRLKAAARLNYLELMLIEVDSASLVDLEKITCIDRSRRSTWGGGTAWNTVRPYQDKSVIRHDGLLELWSHLEALLLRPIFIEGPYGRPIFGVQLPDGRPYPRDDSAEEVAWRTMNRMDFWLTENGTFSFSPRNTKLG